ncbi:hypothetical protein [Actinobaculum sp. 352]|uniref:hypothetical protein n=1 Tax=Actinobaculum sp. 352 TaxID=2490946 RepID=UPI000F7DA8BE|nr:hypothetical protein [Actinobaculum sp. 352]RTE49345.1 hypothetical protein EKN07_07195 [Actinobaculum sp. 352]
MTWSVVRCDAETVALELDGTEYLLGPDDASEMGAALMAAAEADMTDADAYDAAERAWEMRTDR